MPIGWTGGVYSPVCLYTKKYSWQNFLSILQRKCRWDDGLEGSSEYSPDAACCLVLVLGASDIPAKLRGPLDLALRRAPIVRRQMQ